MELSELFKEGLRCSTFESLSPAFSAFHDPLGGRNLGDYPTISDLMTRGFN